MESLVLVGLRQFRVAIAVLVIVLVPGALAPVLALDGNAGDEAVRLPPPPPPPPPVLQPGSAPGLPSVEAKKNIAPAVAKAMHDADVQAKAVADAQRRAQGLPNTAPQDGPPKAPLDRSKPRTCAEWLALNRQLQTAGPRGPTAGVAEVTAQPLTARDAEALMMLLAGQLKQHWRLPGMGGGVETPSIKVRWCLRPDGMLSTEPEVLSPLQTPAFQAAADAAVRAIKSAQPFRLPPDKYLFWRENTWTLDPRKTL